jgi:hypothetical protein
VAITFVDWQDVPRWGLINKALGLSFFDPIETYHTSEHLYTGVGIPAGTTGRLPRKARTHEGLDAEVLEDLGGRQPNTRDRDGRGSSGSGGHGRGHTHHHGQTIPHGHKDGAPKGASAKSGGSKGPDSGASAGGSGDEAAPRKRRNRTRKRTRSGQSQGSEGGQTTSANAGSSGGATAAE